VHQLDRGLDIAGVECGVGRSQGLLSRHRRHLDRGVRAPSS
jgi:hypothetical protein